MTCTGCPHLPHPGRCVSCECAIVTLVPEGCSCGEKVDEVLGLVKHMSARLELALDDLLAQHESHRKVPELEARIAALEARAASNGTGEVLE